jgi:hypothetical protein
MSRLERDDNLDLEMDERLRRFARSSRTPTLPDDVVDLPWTVQRERSRTRFVAGSRFGLAGLRSMLLGLARLGVTGRRRAPRRTSSGPSRRRVQFLPARLVTARRWSSCRRPASSTRSWPTT